VAFNNGSLGMIRLEMPPARCSTAASAAWSSGRAATAGPSRGP